MGLDIIAKYRSYFEINWECECEENCSYCDKSNCGCFKCLNGCPFKFLENQNTYDTWEYFSSNGLKVVLDLNDDPSDEKGFHSEESESRKSKKQKTKNLFFDGFFVCDSNQGFEICNSSEDDQSKHKYLCLKELDIEKRKQKIIEKFKKLEINTKMIEFEFVHILTGYTSC